MRVDAHQHFWRLDRGDYHWISDELPALNRDFLPDDLAPHLEAAGLDLSVAVQAAETLAETRFLLELADQHPRIGGVVGWVDLTQPSARAELDGLAKFKKLKGIRPVLQDMEDTLFVLRPEVIANIAHAHSLGLTFDALIRPRHLPVIAALADRFPDLPIVVDHAAKPGIASGLLQPWADDMRALARRKNVHVKVSGLATEAGDSWTTAQLRPYVDHVHDVFGAHRLMFGSDWPVLELAGSYHHWIHAAAVLTSAWPEDEKSAIFGGTASRFYRLGPSAEETV